MKRIVYFSPDFFFDVDMPIMPYLNKEYELLWLTFLSDKCRFSEEEISSFCKERQIKNISFIAKHRRRSLKQFSLCWKIIKAIKSFKPDVIYMEYLHDPYIYLLATICLPKARIIAAIHDVKPHSNFSNRTIDFVSKCVLNSFSYYQFFSKFQTNLFLSSHKKTVFTIPLALKDSGKATNQRPSTESGCKFLFFGGIFSYKQLDLLIQSCEELYQTGYTHFSLTIAGNGSFWEHCKTLIKHPEIFNCQIHFIPNNEIPNLMNSHHFLILPYKDATQSGPLMNAYQYHLPVVVSNIQGLTEYVTNNKTGFVIEENTQQSLVRTLIKCIDLNDKQYKDLVENLKKDINKHFSNESIFLKYKKMFDSFPQHKLQLYKI